MTVTALGDDDGKVPGYIASCSVSVCNVTDALTLFCSLASPMVTHNAYFENLRLYFLCAFAEVVALNGILIIEFSPCLFEIFLTAEEGHGPAWIDMRSMNGL